MSRRRKGIAGAGLMVLASCVSTDIGPNAYTKEDLQTQRIAGQNAGCAIENQERCKHVIENRILMARFFAPKTLGGLREDEKIKGRRVTTRFVAEAAAAISACRRVTQEALPLIRDMDLDGSKFTLKATAPITETSTCFLEPEASS